MNISVSKSYEPHEHSVKTRPISARCPTCRQLGTFESPKGAIDTLVNDNQKGALYRVGLRTCPNQSCKALLITIQLESDKSIIATYPSLRIDFDASNIPLAIVSSLTEAITCHANECYMAAGIMIRKTLEVMCVEQGATGNNLKERLDSLQTKVILPSTFITALHDLRLLGNDAAHIHSNTYNQIGKEEVEVSLAITKKILEALYQYDDIMAQLAMYKKTLPPTP